MRSMNALQLRQSLGGALAELERTNEPIMLDRGKRHVAVLISLKDFEERFVEKAAAQARRNLVQEMDALIRPALETTPSEIMTRNLRSGY